MLISNWHLGWAMVCIGFASGAVLGLGFHGERFLGGYASWRRRLCRLGHIALIALGMLNVLFAISIPQPITWQMEAASIAWGVGGFLMPTACFLSAWRPAMRVAFVVPVSALLAAAALTLCGGPR